MEGSSGSELQLNQEERERVIEILLGQEKVVALLYDRPPADATSNFSLKQQHTEGVMSSFNKQQVAFTADQTSAANIN